MRTTKNVRFLTQAAMIAALYAVLTYAAAAVNLAYGAVQFRFSETLTVLPVFTPAAIPGLAVGCFLANLGSPLGLVDWIFGTGATLLAAVGVKSHLQTLSDNHTILMRDTRWHLGAGGNLQVSCRLADRLSLGLYSGLTWLTGAPLSHQCIMIIT